MGNNTNIHLPLSMSVDRLMQAIGKLAGTPYEFDAHSVTTGSLRNRTTTKPFFDPEQPSSPANDWHHEFHDKMVWAEGIEGKGMSTVRVCFVDGAGNPWQWNFHAEDSDNPDVKTLAPDSHAMGIAIGRRLVEFFGGQITYNDAKDGVDYEVPNKQALFPVKTLRQSSDDRWYQYENALRTLPVLTSTELEWAATQSSYGKLLKPEEALVNHLRAREKEHHLDTLLPPPSTKKAPGMRF